jgi:hypothetical protein
MNPETVRLPAGQLVSDPPPPQIIRERSSVRIHRQGPPEISLAVPQSTVHEVTTAPPIPRQPWIDQEPVTLRRAAARRDPGRIAGLLLSPPAARGATRPPSTPREFGECERARWVAVAYV